MYAFIWFCLLALPLFGAPVRNQIALYPQATVDALADSINDQVTARFLRSSPPVFPAWRRNRTEGAIRAEFAVLDAWRNALWFENPNAVPLVSNPDYIFSLSLMRNMKYTNPAALPFAYNAIHESYNGSWIVTGDRLVMALEGPSYYTQDPFLFTLTLYRASHLVCLIAEGASRSTQVAPYWQGMLNSAGTEIKLSLDWSTAYLQDTIPLTIPFTALYDWTSEASIGPAVLCAAIQDVRSRSSGTIAIHSVKGSGRSGLFIAGLQAMDELDALNLDFSCGDLVAKLSLQRVNIVATVEQYILLHRLLDYYTAP